MKKLAVPSYCLKDTGSLAKIANTFSIAINTTSVIIREVCKAISKNLGPKYINMSRDCDDMRKKYSSSKPNLECFNQSAAKMGHTYPFFYKQFYNVQVVFECRGQFKDIECVWHGREESIMPRCLLIPLLIVGCRLQGNKLPITFQSAATLRDPAYPLTPLRTKERKSCRNNEHVVFNECSD